MKHLSKMTEQELLDLSIQAIFERNYKLLCEIDEYLFPLQDQRLKKEIEQFRKNNTQNS